MAVRALDNQWVRLIDAVWSKRVAYDPALFLTAQQAHRRHHSAPCSMGRSCRRARLRSLGTAGAAGAPGTVKPQLERVYNAPGHAALAYSAGVTSLRTYP